MINKELLQKAIQISETLPKNHLQAAAIAGIYTRLLDQQMIGGTISEFIGIWCARRQDNKSA